MVRRAFDVLPYGLALLALGIAAVAVTFLSLSEADVTYARSQSTALAAMLLATPALVLYVLPGGGRSDWWRAFWTIGLVAYLAHFWWAVFRTYQGDFGAIVERQGSVAYSNFAVTALWTLDVLLAWLLPPPRGAFAIALRFATWLLVAVSFLAAAAFFRSGLIQQLGYALAIALIVAIAVRVFGFARAPTGTAS